MKLQPRFIDWSRHSLFFAKLSVTLVKVELGAFLCLNGLVLSDLINRKHLRAHTHTKNAQKTWKDLKKVWFL